MALFLWSQQCSLCSVLFVLTCTEVAEVLLCCSVCLLSKFVLMTVIHFLSTCKNIEICVVPEFDSSLGNVMCKLLCSIDNYLLLYSWFWVFLIPLCISSYALCLRIHNCPAVESADQKWVWKIIVLAMSFPADCNCHSSLCAPCPWSTPPSDLFIDSSRPPYNWGHPKAYIQLQWREAVKFLLSCFGQIWQLKYRRDRNMTEEVLKVIKLISSW